MKYSFAKKGCDVYAYDKEAEVSFVPHELNGKMQVTRKHIGISAKKDVAEFQQLLMLNQHEKSHITYLKESSFLL